MLYLELHGDQPERSVRVIDSELWAVGNNLSLANTDFDEFAQNTDPHGTYRGRRARIRPRATRWPAATGRVAGYVAPGAG